MLRCSLQAKAQPLFQIEGTLYFQQNQGKLHYNHVGIDKPLGLFLRGFDPCCSLLNKYQGVRPFSAVLEEQE